MVLETIKLSNGSVINRLDTGEFEFDGRVYGPSTTPYLWSMAQEAAQDPDVVRTLRKLKIFDPMIIITIITAILDALANFCNKIKPPVARNKSRLQYTRLSDGHIPDRKWMNIAKKAGCSDEMSQNSTLKASFHIVGYRASNEQLEGAAIEIYQ